MSGLAAVTGEFDVVVPDEVFPISRLAAERIADDEAPDRLVVCADPPRTAMTKVDTAVRWARAAGSPQT